MSPICRFIQPWLFYAILLVVPSFGADTRAEQAPLAENASGLLFRLQGSNTVGASLAPNLVRDYLAARGVENLEIRSLAEENEYRIGGYYRDESVYVDVAAHGSGTGMRGLASGEAQIAMSSRPIKASEETMLEHLGNMRDFSAEHIIAIDGLAVIVHPDNPLEHLTVEQIARLFSGQIDNWSQLGGPDRQVSLYARDNKSGTWDSFSAMVLGKNYQLSEIARRFESNDRLSDSVVADPAGIGFVGLASVRGAKALKVSVASTQPMKPEPLFVATEDYALSRRLYMYTRPGADAPIVEAFIRFAQSQAGQSRVAQVGFVSQTPVRAKLTPGPEAPELYQTMAEHAERLSVNFRFERGSASLDNKALWDLERLKGYINRQEGKQIHIQLVGFGDAKESQSRSLVLSKMRALKVKGALRDSGVHVESVLGLGAYLPVSGDQGADRFKNQRVEVWVFEREQQQALSDLKDKQALRQTSTFSNHYLSAR